MLTNKYGDEILLFHIDRFLIGHPSCAKRLADIILAFAGDASRISAVMLERRYHLPRSVADSIMTALKSAKAVRHLHEPLRDELAVDRKTAEQLAEYVVRFADGHQGL